MAVPKAVRSVKRPKNTIVVDNGKPGPNQYAVRMRSGNNYKTKHRSSPVNGKVIGHIIDGKYVPAVDPTAENGPNILSYAPEALVKSVTRDIFDDLLAVYPPADVYAIMSIATLRVTAPKMTDKRILTNYNRSFVSLDYPNAPLSHTSVCSLLERLGQDGEKRKSFFLRRIESVRVDHHVAIDGMLKQDTSSVNDLSSDTKKSKVPHLHQISVLYAYDIEKMEPVCAEVFPGKYIDMSAYPDFIRDNQIHKGIIVADKGFPPSAIRKELEENPDLHFLTPLKRNDTRIYTNKMLEFTGPLQGCGKRVLYKKQQIKGGKFLYAFKDIKEAALEERNYVAKAMKKGKMDSADYQKKQRTFGVIVLESDVDLPPLVAYFCYADRWKIELVFDRYKNDECLNRTREQNDFPVIGSEFINFISTVATCRILNKAQKAGLLKKMTYGELMDDLKFAWRRADAPAGMPVSHDQYWIHTFKFDFGELEALGICLPMPTTTSRKRGRPKKTETP